MRVLVKTKSDLKRFIKEDYKRYDPITLERRFDKWYRNYFFKYVKLLRYTEYHYNNIENFYHKILYHFYLRKKMKLGLKINVNIPQNTCDYGLSILHECVYVGPLAEIGKNATFYGMNNIGIHGKKDNEAAKIGDNVIFGTGAKTVGNIIIGSDIFLGANCVVTKSFTKNGSVLIGVPAREHNAKK